MPDTIATLSRLAFEPAAAGQAKTVLVAHAGGSVHRPEDILKAIMEVAR